jgi:hypothetical protein
MPNPSNNKKFIIFPTPRYRKNKKRVIIKATIKPLLEFAKRVEKVKRIAVNNIKKNMGTIPSVEGLIKYIITTRASHETNITINVGKKFLLFLIISRFPLMADAVLCFLINFCFFIFIFYLIV